MPVAHRSLKLTLKLVAGLFVILFVSLLLLLWRLSSSPIQLNQFVPDIEQAAADLPGGLSVRLKGIGLFWNRAEHQIDLRALDVELVESSGSSLVSSPEVDVSLSIFALMRGVIALSSIELQDVDVQLVRRQDGSFQIFKKVDPGQAAVPSDRESRDFKEIIQHAFKVMASKSDPQFPLSYLKRLKIKGSLDVEDQKNGLNWTADAVETLFVGHKGEIKGDLAVTLSAPQALVGISADVALLVKDDAVNARLEFKGLRPSEFAALDHRLAALSGLDMSIGGSITATVTLPDKLHSLKADIKGGAGQFSYQDFYPVPLDLNSLDLQLSADLPGKSLQVSSLDISLGESESPLKLHLTGAVQMIEDAVSLKLRTHLQQLKADEFDLYWPRAVANGARKWLVANLKAGVVDSTKLDLALVVPTGPEADFQLKELKGTVDYSGLTVSYFGSLPPATAVRGSGTYDRHGFDLNISHGLVNGVSIDSGKVVISGLDNKQAAIAIETHLSGDLAAVFAVLEASPIELNRIAGFGSSQLGGQIRSDFNISLPLRSGLAEKELKYEANGTISGGVIRKLLGDYNAQAANVDFHLDQSKLKLDGPLEFAGIPLTIDWTTPLAGDSKGHTEFTVDAPHITATQINALGYDLGDYLQGSLAVKAAVKLKSGGHFSASVKSDLHNTALSIPQIKWHKSRGEPGRIDFTLLVEKDHHLQLENINVESEGFKTNGSAAFDLAGPQLSLTLDQVSLANGELKSVKLERTRTKHLQLSVQGGELHLEPFLSAYSQQNTAQSEKLAVETEEIVDKLDSSNIVFEVKEFRLDKAYINENFWLENIRFSARRDKRGWQELNLSGHNPFAVKSAGSGGNTPAKARPESGGLRAVYGPPVNGQYPVHIEVGDLGQLVSAVKGRKIMEGGHLVIDGQSTGPLLTKPIESVIEVDNFTIKEAPGISMVLNMASLNQLISTFSHKGLAFNSLRGDLNLDGMHLSSQQLRAQGGSLALLGSGSVNLKQLNMNISGTVIPMSNVNAVIGKIPLLGKAVVGSDGKGIMAIEYTLKGKIDDPEVTIKKESMTPGLFRNMFSLGTGEAKTDP